MNFSKVTIITGHYGSGKTNIAVNFAMEMKKQGKNVTVVDLDIVNPYFRTADFEELFQKNGIKLIVPAFANSNLDIPALNFDIDSIVKNGDYVILDVGGDDTGATALGRYSAALKRLPDMQLLYVVNCCRYLTREPEEALELLNDIEKASELKCTGIINNTNLGFETTAEIIENSREYAKKICEAAKLPLICTAGMPEALPKGDGYFPVNIYVRTLWNKE